MSIDVLIVMRMYVHMYQGGDAEEMLPEGAVQLEDDTLNLDDAGFSRTELPEGVDVEHMGAENDDEGEEEEEDEVRARVCVCKCVSYLCVFFKWPPIRQGAQRFSFCLSTAVYIAGNLPVY